MESPYLDNPNKDPYNLIGTCFLHKNIREDKEDRWVTNLSEDRKRFYLVSSLLDPRTKILSFCGNKYFPRTCSQGSFFFFTIFFFFFDFTE
jgi:hypothetical protein